MRPTKIRLDEVAKLAGVSRSTVSRVINDHPNVSPETRRKVLQAIEQLGYRPNSLAQGLARRRTRILGLLVGMPISRMVADQYYPLFLQGAAQAANRRGYRLMLFLFDEPEKQEEFYVDALKSGYLDGVVIVSIPSDAPLVPLLLQEGVPFVCVGKWPGPVSYVDADNYGGGRLAGEHLAKLGYRRIATITGPLKLAAAADRLQGFLDALRAWDIDPQKELIVEADFTEAGGMAAMRKLLDASPEAVFVQSDTMAAGALRVIKAAGLKVPEDIALVSFDDTPLAELVEPPLTAVRQPIRTAGSMAVEVLVDLVEGREGKTRQIILPCELVIRFSCGALHRH